MPQITTLFLLCLAGINLCTNYEAMTIGGIIVLALCTLVFSYGAVGLKLKIWNTMANKTKIQWTDETWNIAIGCTKVDKDCQYCYMYRDMFARNAI